MKPSIIFTIVGAIVALNAVVLLVVLTRRPAAAPAIAAMPAAPASTGKTTQVAGTVAQATNPTTTGQVANRPRPTPLPVEPGFHLDRQALTASGNLRVQYLRDRKLGKKEILLQDAHNAADSAVLAQYGGTAWVVVSPNDEWIALNTRSQGEANAQLYHRVSATPLKYEPAQNANGESTGIADLVWKSYVAGTNQQADVDRQRVTIDATAWDAESRELTLSVTPKPEKDATTPPMAWTCVYNVTTSQLESPPTGEAPNEQAASDAPSDSATAAAPGQDDGTQAGDANTTDLAGEKYPATRQEKITVADANELSLAEVRYAIDEMYARHGATFKDTKTRKTFSQFDWYQPRPDLSLAEAEKDFSDLEKENLAVLERVRGAKISAARRPTAQPLKGQPVEQETAGQRFLHNVLQGASDALNNNNGSGN